MQEAEQLLERGQQAFALRTKEYLRRIQLEAQKLEEKRGVLARMQGRTEKRDQDGAEQAIVAEYQRRLAAVDLKVFRMFSRCIPGAGQSNDVSQMSMLSQIEQRLEQLGLYCAAYEAAQRGRRAQPGFKADMQLRKEEEYERARLKRRGEKQAFQARAQQQERLQRQVEKSRQPVPRHDVRPVMGRMAFGRREVGARQRVQAARELARDFYGYVGDDDELLLLERARAE